MSDHYEREGLLPAILAALAGAGKNPAAPAPDDLFPFDQLHPRGVAATRDLAALAALKPGEAVLDVGCGLGGPARVLAAEFGAVVTGIDLTASFVRAGEALTAAAGLAHRARFVEGDALALPFPDSSYDLAWVQQSAMNIADKAALYGGVRRVLKAGGRLALGDCLAGPAGAPHFPVPWAREPGHSFLVESGELRAVLTAAGFRERAWRDVTDIALGWFRGMMERRPDPASPGAALVMGEAFPVMVGNLLRNLEEGRVELVEAVFDAA